MRCARCNGKKTVNKMGGITMDCPACDGIGHVTIKEKKPNAETIEALKESKVIENKLTNKRGRPKNERKE